MDVGKVRAGQELDAHEFGNDFLVSEAPAVGLPTSTLPFFATSYAVGNLLAAFAKPEFIVDVITLPPGSCDLASNLLEGVREAASTFQVELAGGHTGCYEGIELPLITVTSFGKKTRDRKLPSPGDPVVLVGEPLLESRWLRWLVGESVDSVDWKSLTPVPALRKLMEFEAVKLAHDVSEGGIAGALSELSARYGLGLELSRFAMNIGDELSEPSYGTALAVVSSEKEETLIEWLKQRGISANRIATLGEGNPEFSRAKLTELYGWPTSSFDRQLNRFSLFVKRLLAIRNLRELIPEVGTNVAYSEDPKSSLNQILGIEGRIRRTPSGVKAGRPNYGASSHVGVLLHEVMSMGGPYRVAINIRLSEKTLDVLWKAGIRPTKVTTSDPFCPTLKFVRETRILADAYYEPPSVGMEGGILLLERSTDLALELISTIASKL